MNSGQQIFIGGSGRCGTSILASLFGVHPDVLYFPEPRFLINPGGLNDFLHQRIDFRVFKHNLVHEFRTVLINGLKGLGYAEAPEVYTIEKTEEVIDCHFSGDGPLLVQAANFIQGLFGLGFSAWHKKIGAEKTPHTILMADTLYAMFPGMKYYHILREPKDVCASMMVQSWGPNSPEEFIFYYNKLMRVANEARTRIPAGNYFVVSLETLIDEPLECTTAVFDFAGISSSEALIRRWLDLIEVKSAHVDRWKSALSESEAKAIERYCYPLYHEWRSCETYAPKAMGF